MGFGLAIGVFVLSWLVAVAIHEIGHAVAFRVLGFEIQVFSVWPVCIRRTQTSWELGWARRSPKSPAKNFVAAVPQAIERLRIRTIGTLLAGPFASVAAFGICITVIKSLAPPERLLNFLGEVAIWSLLIAIFTLIPTSRSDGRQVLELLAGRSAYLRANLISSLLGPSNTLRPREWNPALVSLALSKPTVDSADLSSSLHWLKYNWYADTGRRLEAAEALQWLMSEQEGEFGRWLARWEASWFEAFSNNNVAGAREHIQIAERLAPQTLGQAARWKAMAAVAVLEGRGAEAQEFAEKAISSLAAEFASPGIKRAVEDDLMELLARAKAETSG